MYMYNSTTVFRSRVDYHRVLAMKSTERQTLSSPPNSPRLMGTLFLRGQRGLVVGA